MKFCKQLERAVACNPAMQEQPIIRYKQLKKVLKSIHKPPGQAEAGSQQQHNGTGQPSSEAEKRFLDMLKEDLAQFNSFFIEREEEVIIRLQDLGDRIKAAAATAQLSSEQLRPLKTALVDLHGEMVLLLHWSLLNLAAVAKILKKHDKLSALHGAVLLKAPVLANVLQQPFNSTAILNDLIKVAEDHIDRVMAHEAQHQQQQQQGPRAADAVRAADQAAMPSTPAAPAGTRHAADGLQGAAVCARTLMALETWQQLRTNASTPSTVLPADSSDALARALSTRQRWSQVEGLAPIMRQAGGDVQQRQRQQEDQLQLSAADDDNTDNADDPNGDPSGQATGRKHQLSQGLAEEEGGPKRQRPCTGSS